ncbi:hypothetical protein [Intrasporangium sp.]|uniref:hypothetical protein n=1 Tax=Intrasporangium sp. TaxID=1925024 RepID=UPI00293A7B5D|nr:hypothetical protein [Intrasporangium sp.]MDV3221380.1 hypothetical protein [Intrasporangium sp.]
MRSLVSGIAGLLAVVLLPVALLVGWVSSVGTDTEQFVTKMRPVASSPEVRDALTDRVIDAVQGQLGLPDRVAQQLEPPLRELVGTVLARPEVERAWATALRGAHREFVAVMEGERPVSVDATGRVVMPLTIELSGAQPLLDRYGLTGRVDLSPQVPIPLFSAEDLATARRTYAIGSVAGSSAPWIVVGLAGISFLLARRRVRALALLGFGGIIAAAAFAGALVLGRNAAEGVVPDPIGSAVITSAYHLAEDSLMAEARLTLWVAVGMLAVALIAGLVGVILGRRG